MHFFGGQEYVTRPVMVTLDQRPLGPQLLRFVANRTAFKLTAFEEIASQTNFQLHAQKLVDHTDIDALLWANIGRHEVTFRNLMKAG